MKLFKNMKKIPRIIIKSAIWIVSIIILLVIFFIIWLSLFFPSEYVRKLIEEQGKSQLGRVIKIEKLSVSLFSGIKIKNFRIFDSKNQTIAMRGGQIFIKAGEVDLSYSLLPLLWKELEIKKAVIRKPQIHVVKFKSGNFNFSDIINRLTKPPTKKDKKLLKQKREQTAFNVKKIIQQIFNIKQRSYPILAQTTAANQNRAQNAQNQEEQSEPMQFNIKRVGFENAVITYTDYQNPVAPAVFTIDKFNFIVSNINSKNPKKPAKLLLTFQVSAKRIQNRRPQRKMINLFVSISGDVYLFNKKGEMLSTPVLNLRVDLKDALFSGYEFQKVVNRVMEDLKKKFFNQYAKQLTNIIGNFDKHLKKKMNEFIKKYSGKIGTLVSNLTKSRNKSVGNIKGSKASMLTDYKKKANSVINTIESTNNKFRKNMNAILKAASLIPGNKKKVAKWRKKLNSYVAQANSRTASIKKRLNNDNPSSMSSDVNKLLARVKKKYDQAIKKINKTFDKIIAKYVKGIQKKVHSRLKSLVKKVKEFKLNLPFLNKDFKFKHGYFFVSYYFGTASIKRLNIGSKNFKIKTEEATYNTNNGGLKARTDIHADKKYNKNIFTQFFSKKGENIYIPIKVTGTTSNPDVELVGIDLKKKFKEFAVKYGAKLAKKYLGINIPVDRLLSGSSSTGGGDYKSQLKAIKNKYLNKLMNDKKLHQKYLNSIKNKFKKEIGPSTGGRNPVRNLRRRFRF